MSFQIKNLTERPVSVRLRSGKTLLLGPREVASGLAGAELESDGVRKLEERAWIARQDSAPTRQSSRTSTRQPAATEPQPQPE